MNVNTQVPMPIETASTEVGSRILAYVEAAESRNGWIEMVYTGLGYWKWESVVQHPFANACMQPKWWLPVPQIPTK